MPNTDQQSKELSTRENLLMDELILNSPNWLLRSGITLIAITVFVGLGLTWVIKYPDKFDAPFLLTSEHPPIDLVCNVSAQLDSILVEDQDTIAKGQVIMVLNAIGNWKDLKDLSTWLQLLEGLPDANALINVPYPEIQSAGELQLFYGDLLQSFYQLRIYLDQNLTQKKIAVIQSEIKQIERLNRSLKQQEQIYQHELSITRKNYLRSEQLNEDKLMSDKEFERISAVWLQQKRGLENMRANTIQNEIRQKQLLSQQIEFLDRQQQDLHQFYVSIQKLASQLRKEIKLWEETYLITSPISGVINYPKLLTKGQFLNNAQVVATIIPLFERGQTVGNAYLPSTGLGSIEVGNEVQIRLDAFPNREYGIIRSQVKKIALLPTPSEDGKSSYLIEMRLSDTLQTTYGHIIPFKQLMEGKATVITREKRLLERFFENILNVLKNQ